MNSPHPPFAEPAPRTAPRRAVAARALGAFRTLGAAGAIIAALASSPTLRAQVYTPPTQNGGAAPAPQTQQTTVTDQSRSGAGGQQVLGGDAPYFDPSTDVFMFDGKSFNVNDNRVFRAMFERYLNAESATSEEDEAYRAVVRRILDTLSPYNRDPQRFSQAVAQLQLAARFPQDARQSEALANIVYRVYLARLSGAQLQQLNRDLQESRRQLDWNYDTWNRPSRQERKLSDDPAAEQPPAADPVNAGHIQRYVQGIAELEAERVANRARIELSEIEAKLEFQAQIVQYFLMRRFEHVIMGTRLYTEFFQDGAGRLEFKDGSEVEQTFSKMIGFDPTITTLETFATEAIRNVDQAVESFGFLVERGEIDGATRQLQQAFITGEHLPSVQSIPRENKRAVLEYAANSFQLVNALEVKDYTLAEELVAKMREQAGDFDHSKPTAAIEAAKLSSNMRLRTAKNAALQGDDARFEENITAAAQIWPTNPALREEFDLISDSADMQQLAKLEFDRLLGTQSYRQIFNNKARFIAATVEDPERQAALNQVVESIQEIETVMKQAETLARSGNAFAAWEITERTFQKYPDDVILSASRSDLSTEVAPFVRALKNAENLENRRQFGSSLTWYLSARQQYPQSEYAEEGIRRVVDQILPEATLDSASVGARDDDRP